MVVGRLDHFDQDDLSLKKRTVKNDLGEMELKLDSQTRGRGKLDGH